MKLEDMVKPLMDAGFSTSEVMALMSSAEHVLSTLRMGKDQCFAACYGTMSVDALRRLCD